MINKHGQCDILIPLFFYHGRDAEVMIQLKYHLEKRYRYHVEICSIFDPYQIEFHHPRLVLMENVIGSTFHVRFAQYAYQRGYLVAALISEGIMTEAQQVEQGTWGHNDSHHIYFQRLFVWNKQQYRLVLKNYPQLKGLLDLSGAIGFDRYNFYQFMPRTQFIQKYNKTNYRHVVGYAGFVFSYYQSHDLASPANQRLSQKTVQGLRQDKKTVRLWLETLIKTYPDVLFVFKQHPSEMSDNQEMSKLWSTQYTNVLYFQYQESIADLINVCDLWMVYDSTTLLEAWLLDKPTVTLMPRNNFEIRNSFCFGSYQVPSLPKLRAVINLLRSDHRLVINKAQSVRARQILKQVIGVTDGRNSARTAGKLSQLIKQPPSAKKPQPLLTVIYWCNHWSLVVLSWLRFLPILRNSMILTWYSERDEFFRLEKKYRPFLAAFNRSRIK